MGKRRATEREDDDEYDEEAIGEAPMDDVPDADDDAMLDDDDDDEDPDNKIAPGDEMQEVAFDVNVMEPCDNDGVFHVLQRWCPGLWCADMDDVVTKLAESPITSIVKIPPLGTGLEVTAAEAEDDGEVYGVLGLFDFAARTGATEAIAKHLRVPGVTEEVSKKDIATILDPAHMAEHPVALVVNERMTNLPPELGAQLMVNLFEELEEHEDAEREQAEKNGKPYKPFEYFMTLMKVRMNADKELEGIEAEEARLEELKTGKKPVKATNPAATKRGGKRVKAPADPTAEALAVNEDNALFYRPEEIYFFRHRVPDIAVKRYVLDEEKSKDVVVMPVVIHRNQVKRVVKEIKTLDDWFLNDQQ